MRDVGEELGEELGLAVGDTVEMITDDWSGAVASKGELGEIRSFTKDVGEIYIRVCFRNGTYDYPFPLLANEVRKRGDA
ncbi:hypothetical protein [Streptomyces sp. BBFR102]|uniref:hypothetical protein n=1 Tax=Streptomyces sp. BBFR102 TaxID=3448171 RepID=UPI003F52F4B1